MKMKRLLLVLISMFVLVFAGCGGDEVVKPDTGMDSFADAPQWVVLGGAAYPGDQGRAFYGVGSSPKSRDRSIQMNRAQVRATVDLAKQIETYVAALEKDYSASTSDSNAETIESHFEAVRKQVTSQTLSGVQRAEFWFDKTNGDLYMLVKLDLVAFKDSMEKAKELNRQVKEYIQQNSERMHDELKAEEEKRH